MLFDFTSIVFTKSERFKRRRKIFLRYPLCIFYFITDDVVNHAVQIFLIVGQIRKKSCDYT